MVLMTMPSLINNRLIAKHHPLQMLRTYHGTVAEILRRPYGDVRLVKGIN